MHLLVRWVHAHPEYRPLQGCQGVGLFCWFSLIGDRNHGIWRCLGPVLGAPSRWCYEHRKNCGCLGEVLLVPILGAWVAWPAAIPIVAGEPYLWLVAGPLMIYLLFHGVRIVRASWGPEEQS